MTDEILLEQEKMIYYIAQKFSGYYDIDDLYQAGVEGLTKAYKNYNNNEQAKFSTYAYKWIYWEMMEFIRKDRSIKINKDIISLNKKIEKMKEIMTQKLMREPTTLELSLMLDIDEDTILEVKRQVEPIKSLDYCIDEDEHKYNLYNSIKSEERSYDADIQDLKMELNALEQDELKLIKSRYYEDLTQEQTSKLLGITQVQVYRKEKKILKKLEKRLVA